MVDNKPKARTKVVVRNLPPELTQEKFVETIEEHQAVYDYLDYRPGKKTAKKKQLGYCFINFVDTDSLLKFFNQFSNHNFADEKGNRYKISIEYAPFQGVPKDPKSDTTTAREGAILNDEDYLQFVEKLSAPRVMLPSAEAQLEKRLAEEAKLAAASPGGVAPPIISPLVAELRAKKERIAAKNAQKKKPVKRRKPKAGDEKKGAQAEPVAAKKILARPAGASASAPALTPAPSTPAATTASQNPPQTTGSQGSQTPGNQSNKPYRGRNKKPQGVSPNGAPNNAGNANANPGANPKPQGGGGRGRGKNYGNKPKPQAKSQPTTPVVIQQKPSASGAPN